MAPHEEARRLADTEQQLKRAYPTVPADKVKTAIEQARMNFLHARVRDYVPLLVQHEVATWLRTLA